MAQPSPSSFGCQYAQLHSVSQKGRVMMAEGPLLVEMGKETILKIGDPKSGQQVTWQLSPDMPTLKVGANTFMFAVPSADHFFAIDFIPEMADSVVSEMEKVLQACTSYAVSEDTPESSNISMPAFVKSDATGTDFKTSKDTAGSIQNAGAALAGGIETAGVYVGKGIVYAGVWLRKNTKANEKPVEISAKTSQRIDSTKAKSEKLAGAAASAAAVVGGAVSYAAGAAANAVRSTGVTNKDRNPKTGGVASVGKAAIIALVDVFEAMHTAGKHAVALGVDETATCVEYRYGPEAGRAALTTLDIANDAYDVYGSYRSVRTRAIMKAFAKGAVKQNAQGEVVSTSSPPVSADGAKPVPQPGSQTESQISYPPEGSQGADVKPGSLYPTII